MDMFAAQQIQIFPPESRCLMITAVSSKLSPPLLRRLSPTAFKVFAAASSASPSAVPTVTDAPEIATILEPLTPSPASTNGRRRGRKSHLDTEIATIPEPLAPSPASTNGRRRGRKSNLDTEQLKLNWLKSLSCPLADNCGSRALEDSGSGSAGSDWVIGVDPDLSGALAVLKPDNSAQVFDSPHLQLLVGKRVRKRLDVRSIIQLLQTIDAPAGTTVYLEQSIPFPQDGKQGWWSGGFGYGLWIGILVTSGYSVVPVPSFLWKSELKLSGNRSSKDESRELATELFPTLSSSFKRKKDHGRAEALLIAAYGKGLKVNHDSSHILDAVIP